MPASNLLTQLLPELILLVGACGLLFLGATRLAASRSFLPFAGVLVLVAALVVTIRRGEPDGSFAAMGLWISSLTHYVRWVALSVGILILLVNWYLPVQEERGEFVALILLSLLGVLLTASANDWLVLFFAIELVSIPTYILIALSRLDQRAAEASVKYFFLGALSAAILAFGLSFLYGASGTTQIQHIAGGVISLTLPSTGELGSIAMIGFLFVLAGLAFKVAAVPFHVYAPDVYEGAAAPITGMLGFVPKLAGFVALIKLFAAIGWNLPIEIKWLVWILAAVTMTAGNVIALLQDNVKRMLAYSSIAHTGYMLVALLIGPVAGEGPMHDGVAALLFYIAVYGAMNLGAFAMIASFGRKHGELETLDDMNGIASQAPAVALALAICVFSLMGFPPTAGFIGKLYILTAAFSFSADHAFAQPLLVLAIVAVVNTVISAGYYLRIVAAAYVGKSSTPANPTGGFTLRWGLAVCSLAMLVLFVWPRGLAGQASRATAAIHDSVSAAHTVVRVDTDFGNAQVDRTSP